MAISVDNVAATLESFIRKAAGVPDDDSQFSRTVHLFDAGYVDSLLVVSLITFIEESFAIELDEEELFDEDFVTIEGMSNIIFRHASSGC